MRGIVGSRRRKEKQRHIASRRLFADLLGHGQPVLVRQLQIEDDAIEEIAFREESKCLAAASGRFYGHAPLLAALCDDAPISAIVFDDQQAFADELRLRALAAR